MIVTLDLEIIVDDLHETLLEAEQALREIDEQLPEPLMLDRSLTELHATADAYARLDSPDS
ncbi:hypothetical protein NP511_21730 [Natrinema thermotolerans]|uniref:Uncharacterized protein n=1 Tax=Natrinema thermotolerans TaxID=121872 RepID=A0AAF0PEF0_9EURY|nr:hypothetical protein [Natrinema thermotolerans]QCC61775.1 hypothetical protein DVR14_24890 [Natrinema thermotolerans]WMT07974.1 hypothetical protein NP511_21730 [Natrinema thermotolerans]